MPLHNSTLLVPPVARAVAVAVAACVAAGTATVAIAGEQPFPQVRTVGDAAITRYFDIEANKATSMRALGRHIAEQPENHAVRYDDLESNKARSAALLDRLRAGVAP